MTHASGPERPVDAAAGEVALRDGVAWADVGPRTVLAARGPDAVRFVDAFTTASVAAVAAGGGTEGFFTDARGWVLALANLLRIPDGVLIDAPPGLGTALRDHLEHHHIRERVEITDESDAWWHVLLAGPRARDWLTGRASAIPPERPLDHVPARLGPVDATIIGVDGQWPRGFLARVPVADRGRLGAWLTEEGLPRVDAGALEAARLAAGFPLPADIPERTLPQELGRDARAICFTKGCYLGQETVARLDALGHVNRRLVAIALDGPAEPGVALSAGDEVVGRLTSVGRSAPLGGWAGLGLVLTRALDPAVGLTVAGRAARRVTVASGGVPSGGDAGPPAAVREDSAADPAPVLLRARRFDVVRVSETCADGTRREREVVRHPGSVVVVPLLPDDRVCLVEVVRVAVGRTLLELPAGTLDREEPLAAAAARELAEETGYRAGRIEPAGGFWMSPGILRERMHLFVARDLVPGPQALEPGEQIRVREVPWREAVAMCLDGRIDDAKTVAGILLAEGRRRTAAS